MRYWFTADYHLGHANIIKYCGRTLFMTKKDLETYKKLKGKSQEEQRHFKISNESLRRMNKRLIKNHNERVKKGDVVFFIGDFCFKNTKGGKKGEGDIIKAKEYEQKLNGKIIFIKGNHDKNNSCKTIIESIVIRFDGKWIKLVHKPDTQYIETKYDLIFCGHIHNLWKFKRIREGFSFVDAINVGVDVNNFMPKSFNELMKEYYRWKKSSK